MTNKLIFFDIDGTLLTDDNQILNSTKEAIATLRERGHEVAIATGRNALMARDIIEELEMDNYVVCNGAAAFYHGRQVYINPLDKEDFERLLLVADAQGHPIVYETAEQLKRRHKEVDSRLEEGMSAVGFQVPESDFSFHERHDLTQALVFYDEKDKGDYEEGQFPHFRFIRWHETGVDILPKDGSKAATIMKIATAKGYQPEDVVAFGDGLNDYEMISKVGLGIAMGNAVDAVKAEADYVTKTNNKHGIALALQELNLL
ncbi:Cof-type HAD-IIB family hydrolase [Atopococcus tabaci]|uniref:Cof-type HAD-IIB family hydrolase n=1 Tax=Atopococcus tabaci TaxID=269774 RepID=UPI0003FCE313|nr:Cof-type HAD-IIB family hydrolase [Atopococcus tabaci]